MQVYVCVSQVMGRAKILPERGGGRFQSQLPLSHCPGPCSVPECVSLGRTASVSHQAVPPTTLPGPLGGPS